MHGIKSIVYELCMQFIKQRIETAEIALAQAREASNDDTKSSAGDKYETSREMMQQDIDRNKRLLMDAQANLRVLQTIAEDMTRSTDLAKPGSIVRTSQGVFYISISAGQLLAGEEKIFAVSPASPVGSLLLHKRTGDTFTFNGRNYLIDGIE